MKIVARKIEVPPSLGLWGGREARGMEVLDCPSPSWDFCEEPVYSGLALVRANTTAES